MDDYRALWIWRRASDGRMGIAEKECTVAEIRDYGGDEFEVIEYVPAEQLRGAVELLRGLSEHWTDVRVSGNAARITALGDSVKRAREFTASADSATSPRQSLRTEGDDR